MNNIVRVNKNSGVIPVIIGFLISFILSIVTLYIYAVILVNTGVQENTIKPVVITISSVSLLIGSSISSLKIKSKGIINGICVSLLYLVSMYLLSSIILCGFSFNLSSVIMIAFGILLGGIGGIIGVNIKK